MDQLPNPIRKPPKKPKKFGFFGLTLAEFPLVITMGTLILAHVWYGSYLFSDELSEENRTLRYIPFRSDYEDFRKGLNNIRKRFFAKKAAENETVRDLYGDS
ncbi:uncharacterized protein LOC135846209 [Planococcus citri]|uniref:uncharacterized protein LOC135846209 n=1 Tax=Planococcus citri TaxID=170843 RepID=UPI0031F9E23B